MEENLECRFLENSLLYLYIGFQQLKLWVIEL